jgi:TolB protein
MLQLQARRVALGAVLTAAALLWTGTAGADQPAAGKPADKSLVIDVTNPQRSRYPIAVPAPVIGDGASGKVIAEVADFDLRVAGWFKLVGKDKILADLKAEGLTIVPQKWKDSGAYGVMKFRSEVRGNKLTIDFKLYEVEKGDQPVLVRTYQGGANDVRKLTHMWCNEVVKYYTGEDGFFGSRIAFVTKNGKGRRAGKKILSMDFDGNGVFGLTRNSSINILPAWSPSGTQVAFTSYMRDNPDLYVVGAGGGRPRRVSRHSGMNTGAAWSPDGRTMAVTLSKDGNPEIYLINATNGAVVKRLTRDRSIDTSPSFSPSGKEIAFVSDREGGPQIFVMNADGSKQRRVSMNGSYNTTPTWSPQKGKRILAYTTRADKTFDIVTLDLDSGKMVRITQNEGVNEEPAFSPNGRAIAFASTRKSGAGIYIANADGTGDAIRVWKGWATSVDWGPTPSQ